MITYIVYMYTTKEEQQEKQKTSSITMKYKIRTQRDLFVVEMKIKRYLKNKNIDNIKNLTILNWKELGD